MTGLTNRGELTYQIGFTRAEIEELILLIDDEPVDEEFLAGVRKKLAKKQKALRRRERAQGGEVAIRGD